MELPLSIKMSEYESLLSKQRSEIKEQTLIVILGSLIFCGWFLLGINLGETSRTFIGVLNSCLATTAIFLGLIPYSISFVFARWIDVAKNLCLTNYAILKFQMDFTKNFPGDPQSVEFNAYLNTTKTTYTSLRLTFAKKALFTALLLFILACLSGSIGFEKAEHTNILAFLLSSIVFLVQVSRILSIAANLVTIIQNKSK